MKKIFLLLCFFSSFFLQPKGFAANVSVQVCTTNNVCSFQLPSSLIGITNLSQIKFVISNVNMTVTIPAPGTYSPNNWGVQIANGGTSTPINCPLSAPCDQIKITIPNNAINVTTQNLSGTTLTATGTLYVTLDFSQTNKVPPGTTPGYLPADINNMILANSNLTVAAYYSDPNTGGTPSPLTSTGSAAPWQPDFGAIINAPSILPQAMDSAFSLSLTPPSSTSAVTQSPSTGTPTSLVSTTANSITGYVIAYWKDSNCSFGGGIGWTSAFAANPVSYATAPGYSCAYTPYSTSFNIGGTSSVLGCTTVGTFLPNTAGPALTADTAAIPNLPNGINDLAYLIANPLTELSAGCMNVTYVPATQSSWTKSGLANDGTVYGATAWVLNAAVPTPNYSLAHANISYITPISFTLASLVKSPDLAKTTDCFVVTAASGHVDSKSVFYWRILRDSYLTPIGFTKYYYNHARTWAAWLNEHPRLKPPLNFIFEKSGYFFYHMGEFIKQAHHNVKDLLHKFIFILSNLFDQKADASEFKDFKPPRYELFVTGGILFPTQDKSFYDTYYSSQQTSHIELGANRIFWLDHFGFSTGALGRYLFNSENESAPVLGSYVQPYTRTIYSVTAEVIGGVRYRAPSFVYIIPGVFAGIGATRFREEASISSTGTASTLGVTQWSPIYEFGGNLDISLLNLIRTNEISPTYWLNDILFRFSGSYNINPTKALSSTGFFVQGGFSFLIQ